MNKNKIITLSMPILFILISIWAIISGIAMGDPQGKFPKMIGGFTLVVAIFQLYFDIKKNDFKNTFKDSNLFKVIETIVILFVYIFLLYKIGYLLDTTLLSIYVIYSLGYRKLKVVIPFSILLAVVVFFLFRFLLRVPLPVVWLNL